jgi:PAS domain-containing protein
MAQLELYLSLELKVVRFSGHSEVILGSTDAGVALLDLLSDEADRVSFSEAVKPVIAREAAFNTLNLVFKAPGAPGEAPRADRSPLNIPHAYPGRYGFHSGSQVELSCFTLIELSEEEGVPMIRLVATEYSRQHRKDLVGKEFGNWLVHNCVENAVIATRPSGEIVFWNEHACKMYQWTEEKALERGASILVVNQLKHQEEIKGPLKKGEHHKRMWNLKRKDNSRHQFSSVCHRW